MIKTLNAVSITLLVALVAVVPAALLGPHLPGYLDLGLQRSAVAAWIAGLASWWLARAAVRKEQEAAHETSRKESNGTAVALTIGFLAAAAGIAVLLHFFGDAIVRAV